MSEWHPVQIARPAEWELRASDHTDPVGIIRRLQHGRGSQIEIRYRAVTWASSSSERKLIGYYRTLDDAAQAAWSSHLTRSAAQHRAAAGGMRSPSSPERKVKLGNVGGGG
jgi:hypothetical protein